MAPFSQNDSEVIRQAAVILFKELLRPGTIPGGQPEFRTLEDIRRFVDVMGMEFQAQENVRQLRDALAEAGAVLAAAHAAASSIVVAAPSDEEIAEFKHKLEALNADIQADQRFHTALGIAIGLVNAINEHTDA